MASGMLVNDGQSYSNVASVLAPVSLDGLSNFAVEADIQLVRYSDEGAFSGLASLASWCDPLVRVEATVLATASPPVYISACQSSRVSMSVCCGPRIKIRLYYHRHPIVRVVGGVIIVWKYVGTRSHYWSTVG